MIVSLIGMSNVGKSHWAKRLEAEYGFTRFCCDDLIAKSLSASLPDWQGESVGDLAKWMGMPYEFGYAQREAAYLTCEESALRQILEYVLDHENVVIDTTGSVIYLPSPMLDRLKAVTSVVYFEAGEDQVVQMTERFFHEPKPLVWGQGFTLQFGETHEEALRRCYPDLLDWRHERYLAMAGKTIPYEVSHNPTFDLYAFLLDQQS
jgi:shikimate kinase